MRRFLLALLLVACSSSPSTASQSLAPVADAGEDSSAGSSGAAGAINGTSGTGGTAGENGVAGGSGAGQAGTGGSSAGEAGSSGSGGRAGSAGESGSSGASGSAGEAGSGGERDAGTDAPEDAAQEREPFVPVEGVDYFACVEYPLNCPFGQDKCGELERCTVILAPLDEYLPWEKQYCEKRWAQGSDDIACTCCDF